MISPRRATNKTVTLSPSPCVILSEAKNLPSLRACPERSEGINSAKGLRPLETSVAEILRFAALAQNDTERRAQA